MSFAFLRDIANTISPQTSIKVWFGWAGRWQVAGSCHIPGLALQQWGTWCPWGLLLAQERMSGSWLDTDWRQYWSNWSNLSGWHIEMQSSPNSVTATFELSVFECGIYGNTQKDLVFWYFWLKKDTWLLVSMSFLVPLSAKLSYAGSSEALSTCTSCVLKSGSIRKLGGVLKGLIGSESFGKTLTGLLTGCWTPEYLPFTPLGGVQMTWTCLLPTFSLRWQIHLEKDKMVKLFHFHEFA